MWHGYGADGAWFMGGGMLFMLLFWILAIIGLVVVVRKLFGSRSQPADRSLQLLKERLAKGEIDQAEFERLYRLLRDAQ